MLTFLYWNSIDLYFNARGLTRNVWSRVEVMIWTVMNEFALSSYFEWWHTGITVHLNFDIFWRMIRTPELVYSEFRPLTIMHSMHIVTIIEFAVTTPVKSRPQCVPTTPGYKGKLISWTNMWIRPTFACFKDCRNSYVGYLSCSRIMSTHLYSIKVMWVWGNEAHIISCHFPIYTV